MNAKFKKKTHVIEDLHKGELYALKLAYSQETKQLKCSHP
jgi:hypothetical protein